MPIAESPSTTLYTLGKGILSIGEWVGDVAPVSLTDVGNCPRMDVEVTEETLPHYSSRSGTRLKDKQVTLETGYTVTFDLDEISILNLQTFLRGTLTGVGKKVIHAMQALDKEHALMFVSDNAVGPNEIWELWKVRLTPAGTFSLIGEDWSTLSFSGEGLADTAGNPDSPFFDVTMQTTTTSMTTTTSTMTTTSSTTTTA